MSAKMTNRYVAPQPKLGGAKELREAVREKAKHLRVLLVDIVL